MAIKHTNRRHLTSRRVAARLAGAAVFGFSPLVHALQELGSVSIDESEPQKLQNELRLSIALQPKATRVSSNRQLTKPLEDFPLSLRVSGFLQSLPTIRAAEPIRSTENLPRLRSSSTLGGASTSRQRLSSGFQSQGLDRVLGLQASRTLQMPGVANIGRTQPVTGRGNLIESSLLGSEDYVSDDESLVAPAANVRPLATNPGTEAQDDGVSWVVPPIRWGGTVGYGIQYGQSSSGGTSLSQGVYSGLNASSFIYAPWFATVSGRLGVTSTTSETTTGVPSERGSNDNNMNVVGGAEINLLSASRFPFQAYIDRSDSSVSGIAVTTNYVNTRFGLRQNYRSEDGLTTAGGQFDHSVVDTSNGQGDVVTSVNGNVGAMIGIVRNSVNARYSLGQRESTGEQANLFSLNSSHSATLEDNLNFAGNFSYVDNLIEAGRGQRFTGDILTRSLQLSGFGSWMPEFEDTDDLPLSLSGGVNYASVDSSFGGEGGQTQSLGANLGAQYRFTNNFSVGANAALNQVNSLNQSVLLTTLGGNVVYAGDPLNFGQYSYNWNTGANLSWQGSSGEIPANSYYGLNAGHGLSRFFAVSDTDNVSVTLSQNLNYNQSQFLGGSAALTNSLGANYSLRLGDQFSGNTNLSISSSMTTGSNATQYESLSLGFFGQGQFSQVSSANINLQFSWSEQQFNTQQQTLFQNSNASSSSVTSGAHTSQHMSVYGSASYTHGRFLSVRGLRYSLTFNADTRLRDQRLLGDTGGAVEPVRYGLTNRLEYRIGLLNFAAGATFNEVDGKQNALLFLQVMRQIGSY